MDTGLSDHSSLEGLWADHPDRAVSALPVVVQLNLLEHLHAAFAEMPALGRKQTVEPLASVIARIIIKN